jgi:hemerythrin superfamily protein
MDAIQLIEHQHQMVKDLFARFKSSRDGSTEALNELFARLADAIAAHSTMEEKLFYPNVYVGDTAEKLRESVEEHLVVKRLIADMLDLEPTDEQFLAKMKVLEENVLHHVGEEERSLLPSVKKKISQEDLDSMGEEMEALFSELLQAEPRLDVVVETDQAAPLP